MCNPQARPIVQRSLTSTHSWCGGKELSCVASPLKIHLAPETKCLIFHDLLICAVETGQPVSVCRGCRVPIPVQTSPSSRTSGWSITTSRRERRSFISGTSKYDIRCMSYYNIIAFYSKFRSVGEGSYNSHYYIMQCCRVVYCTLIG